MTTEEERKAAAEKVYVLLVAKQDSGDDYARDCREVATDLQFALTRTEKRLEVAEGLLREAMVHVAKFPLDSRLRALYLAIRNFLQSTSRGEVAR